MFKIRKYTSIIAVTMKSVFNYRINAIAGVFVSLIQILVLTTIWTLTNSLEIENNKIQTYFIFSTIILRIVEFGRELYIGELIKSGEIAIYLLRPVHFLKLMIFEGIGAVISKIILNSVPILIVGFLFFDLFIQSNLIILLCSFISLCFSILLVAYIDLLFGLLTFKLENGWGIRKLKQALLLIFSGGLIPIYLLPESVQKISNVLPFKDIVSTPINIYLETGEIHIINSIFNQIIWILIIATLTGLLYKNIVKIIDINGG